MGRATLQDVARQAGVSVATVDRVLNRRPGVRADTVRRVEEAVESLGYRPDPLAARLARATRLRFCFLLPTRSNSFATMLVNEASSAAGWLADQRAEIDVCRVDVFDPLVLAETLYNLDPGYQGVALVALDHPAVREAIDGLVARGVTVVTVVSDVPASRRQHFVGIDNSAAGRTAGTLMVRLNRGRKGAIGVIASSFALRDQAERLFGFQQVVSARYPDMVVLPPRETRDDFDLNRSVAGDLLAERPDLIGIYSIGAGNRGIVAALEASGRAQDVVFIGHELTAHSRAWLTSGVMDVVIDQNPGHEIRSAARVLVAHAMGVPLVEGQEHIRIGIYIRDNLP